MAEWSRKRGDDSAEWHLNVQPVTKAGMFVAYVAACGFSLGQDLEELEQVQDESVTGNRCPACQGAALGATRTGQDTTA
jgi:hypothetical protein